MAALGSLTNTQMSVAKLYVNGVYMGHTMGGVKIKVERKFEDKKVDQFGDTPADKVLVGQGVEVVAQLAEPVAATINRALPEGSFSTGLGVGVDAGYLLGQDSFTLKLHPAHLADSDTSEDWNIWKAVSSEPVELNYKVNEQRIVEVTFTGLIDDTQTSGYKLAKYGAPTVS